MKPFDSKDNSSEWELNAQEQEILMKSMEVTVPKELDDRLAKKMLKLKSQSNRRAWTKIFLTAAASFLFIFSLGMAISPTFASYVKSLFMEADDLGLQEAFKNGYSKTIGKQVTDQGITVRVKEVIADLNRISVSYEIIDKNGKMIDASLIKNEDENILYLTNKKGETLSIAGTEGSVWGKNQEPRGGIIEFQLPKNEGKQFVFHLNIANIGEKTNEDGTQIITPGVDGKWELQVPIDLTKGLKASKEIKIGANYNWKNELKLTIDRLILSPSLTRLLYEVDQSDELMKLPDDGFGMREVNLRYYITDERNKKVATYGSDDFSSGAETTTNSVIQHPPFPKSKHYVFHLTGLAYSTVVNESFSITSKTLPVTKNTSLGKITIKSIKKEEGNTIIEIEGVRPKNVQTYGWTVRDEKGQPEEFFTFGSKNGKLQGENVNFTEEIGIEGEPITDKLQLQIYAVKKYYPVNWSFQIKGE